jgi:type I restriction enzyme S subunit
LGARQELRDICVKIQDGTHFSPKLGGSDYFYVTSRNIGRGVLDLSSVETISAEEHAKIYTRCDTREGDLLLTKDGAKTGNAAINSLDEPISLLSSVAMLRFDPKRHSTEFFLQQILSESGQKQIKDMMSGNAITRLTLAKIKALKFDVPPLDEQFYIATTLSEIDAELEALTTRLAKARQIKQGMMQELLTGRIRLVFI